jgi:AcrR family transcriptional regulator
MFTLSTPSEGRSYHHRDLSRALVRSALEILSEAGVAGLSLRAAARRAKVSAMAPYRHFADKEALLAAVAKYGFRQLTARLTAAVAGAPDPRAGLGALGVAYVLFARDEPSLFKLMFGPAIERKSAHPGLDEAGRSCFDALRHAVEAAIGRPIWTMCRSPAGPLCMACRRSSSTEDSPTKTRARPRRLLRG